MQADVVNIHAGALVDTYAPVVHSCHGYYWTGDMPWERMYWEYNTPVIEASRRAAEIIVPSRWVAYPIQRDMRVSPYIIQHGIDIEGLTPTNSLGYVLWAKPRTDVVSDPAPVNELAQLARDVRFITTFGIPAQNVQVIGPRPHLDFLEVLRHAEIWLATTRETGDIASREAMALGIPVLGWNWGATGELVQHGETGYLATPGDYEDLLEGLRYCLKYRNELGAAAREYVREHCQWKDIMPLYADVFYKAMRGNQYPVKVSVVIPTYNYAHYLPECLSSVLGQSMFDYEIIVVDDGSTDNTPQLLALYASEFDNVKVIRQNNQGLVGALNTGHKEARGRYIVNLDADNLLPRDALKILSKALDNRPWLDVASGGLSMYKPDGNHVTAKDWPWGRINPDAQFDHYNQLHSSSMMRARSIERLGGYRHRQYKNEDGEFWCRAMSAGLRFEQVTEEPTLIYRWHDGNKSKVEGGEDDPEGPMSWNFYYPWRKHKSIMPFAVTATPTKASWPVRSYDDPHIAVIIACGPNHDRYLPDALDSVIAQTFQKFECIVANDTGYKIDVAAMGHPWVRVVNTEGRQGPAIARNTAIAAAKAPLILPLDADDMLYPKAIELFYCAWLDARENLVYGDCFTEDTPGRRTRYHSGPWSWDKIRREAIYQVTALYARQWWEAVGGYDTGVPWEDWIFGLKLHFMGIGATYVDEPWGVYRHWTGRKSDDDAEDFGTPKFKEKLEEVYAYIKELEEDMGCKGCGKRATPRRASQTSTKIMPVTGPDVLMVYTGWRTGSFSLNSRAQPGKKYRVMQGEEFPVLAGDAKWTADLEGFEIVEQHNVAPSIPEKAPSPLPIHVSQRPIAQARREPRRTMAIGDGRASRPSPQPEQPTAKTPLSASELPGVSDRMLLAMQAMGIDSIESLREEFLVNGTSRLRMIKGLKERRLEALREHVGA